MNNLNGLWPGIVINNKDSLKKGRLQIRVPQIFGDIATPEMISDADLPWAFPCFPFFGKNSGIAMIPEINSGVWVTFLDNDPRNPVWLGGWFGELDNLTEFSNGYIPEPKNFVIKTPGEKVIKLSDIPDSEEIVLQDNIGQHIKLNSSDKKYYLTCLGEANESIATKKTEVVGTDYALTIGNNLNITSTLQSRLVAGSIIINSLTTLAISSLAALTVGVGAALTITAVGTISLVSSLILIGLSTGHQKLLNQAMLILFNAHTHTYTPGSGTPTQTGSPTEVGVENIHTTINLQGT